MQTRRLSPSCSSACSTSGRQHNSGLVVLPLRRNSLRVHARKQHAGDVNFPLAAQQLPPETIITDYPDELEEDGLTSATLASTDEVELLTPEVLDSDEGSMETIDEENPYSPEDALSFPVEGLAGGEPALEQLLAEGGSDLSPDRIASIFPFPLDPFQRRALELFLEGRSVVVCAPTGAGKTAIAEAAAAAALARGQRVIYTTPLKALSNQKLFETRRRFGHARCGLQTGDANLNPDAAIVVMTTEILRNIMYRTAELAEQGSSNSGSQSTREARLGDVGLIVLDEVHYLGDPSRGSVWEEVIINCPRHIQLLCMSATVQNPGDLGDWIAKEHMPCETIQTRFRPVPLHWHFAYYKQPKGVHIDDLLLTFHSGKQTLNPKLSNKTVLAEEARSMLAQGALTPGSFPSYRGRGGGRGGRGGSNRSSSFSSSWSPSGSRSSPTASFAASSSSFDPDWGAGMGEWDLDREVEALLERDPQALQRRVNLRRLPDMGKTIAALARGNMLPAIWFILSRRECDSSALRAASSASAVRLTSPQEAAAIAAEVAALRADQAEAVREEMVPALLSGMASHHAGQLPGWRALVERLFQRGLLKIVFATGTLAAGINMPARTTVLSGLSRYTPEGPQLLPHNELLQMAGRAGRRGYDSEGHCVVLQNKFEGAEEAWQIIRAGPEPLSSRFSVSYGLVLNLLSVNSLEQAHEFVSRSFGNYLATEGQARREAEAEELEAEARALVEAFKNSATARAKELNAKVKEVKDELRRLRAAQLTAQCQAAQQLLTDQPSPRIVVLNLAAGGAIALASSGNATGGLPKPLLMPALLVGETEPPAEVVAAAAAGGNGHNGIVNVRQGGNRTIIPPPGPYYMCLSADNRLMRVSVACIAGVLEGAEGVGAEEDAAKVRAAAERVRPNAWSNVEAGSWALQAALGSPATSPATRPLQARLPWRFVEGGKAFVAQIAAQRREVKAAVVELEEQRRLAAGGGNKGDGSLEKMARAKRLLKRAEKLRQEGSASSQLESTWKTFQMTMEILIATDALEVGSLRVLPLGLLARNIQGGNELWLALALSHPALERLSGPALGALLGALLSPEVINKPTNLWAAYPVSPEVEEAVAALEPRRQLLLELQTDAGLTRWNDALLVDLRLAGLVEAWASGASWSQVIRDSGLDDGDLARLLMRTSDLLRQLLHSAHLLPALREAAAEALRGIDRKPVADQTL
ncbi:hypothetical protein Agub_g377 [Astrephomene gubernaculifera]|uniref:Uncharacterized protein n=1 Tax=Astrephomene gubernaculifera TaxID=47775 RepID=A0AAD3HGU6_9CHLO|nr:hypothetical protein Agub_g377 [Astrephomene gubernaculifera]